VLALTEQGSLWRSGDGGNSWTSETSNLLGSADAALTQLVLNRGIGAQTASQPQRVYLAGRYSSKYNATLLWSTTNGGVTYNQPCVVARGDASCISWPGGTGTSALVGIIPHPLLVDVALAITRTAVCRQSSAACIRQDLWVTRSGGHTWSNASATGDLAGVIEAQWAPEASIPNSPSRLKIFATAYMSDADRVAGVWFQGYWDKRLNLVSSTDLFASRAVVNRRCGNAFSVMPGGAVYLGVAGNCDGAVTPSNAPDGWAVSLYLSKDSGVTWQVTCFPLSEAEHGYSLYSNINGTDVYINVDHTDDRDPVRNNQPLGVVHHGDKSGRLFSLARRNVLLQPSGASDLMLLDALDGAAFVNTVDEALFSDPDFLSGAKTAYDSIQSRFSTDAGSLWRPLSAATPLPGSISPCAGGAVSCSLHVHGPDALFSGNYTYAGVYSVAAAPGVVLSTGSEGQYLSYDPAIVNTYISWDGGTTFNVAAIGPHTYEVAAYGGLIVLAPTNVPADHALFSMDGGRCWQQVKLARPLLVTNIQVVPGNGPALLLLHGILVGSNMRGVIYTLDFQALLLPQDFPACGTNDYEAWAPVTCQRGQAAIYTRRKQHSRCLPVASSRSASRPCGCNPASDYECAFGYERSDKNGQCVAMTDFALDPGCPAADPSPTRLIAGDLCAPGGQPSPSSPKSKPRKHKGPGPAAIFFIVILCLSCTAALLAIAARLLGLPLPPAVARTVDEFIQVARSGLDRLKGRSTTSHVRLDDSEWLDSDDASFSPLAGSYAPPPHGHNGTR